jgi:DNA topoisomerase I
MTLVILESHAKQSTVQKILGNDYKVIACYGHIMDLPNKSIGLHADLTPQYTILPTQINNIAKIKKEYAKSNGIILATDIDREGEMIAWSLANILSLDAPKRMVYNEITKKHLLNAVNNTQSINYNLVNAQKTRRVLDRMVGYKISPLLWNNVHGAKSAGRVQSVVLKLIVEKEKEINQFIDNININDNGILFRVTGTINNINSKPVLCDNKHHICDISKPNIEKLLKKYKKSSFIICDIANKTLTRHPNAPYTTSTLQQDAHTKFGYSLKKTMQVAQQLYEKGYITYMRTDSVNLSNDILRDIGKYVLDKYGKTYYGNQRVYSPPNSNTQEAHEAIRPCNIHNTPSKLNNAITNDMQRIYGIIWKRTVASQMTDAKINNMCISININNDNDHIFTVTHETITFYGFLIVYKESSDNEMISVNVGDDINMINIIATEIVKQPPNRYNEGTLVKTITSDKYNIGRPSTIAGYSTVLINRQYIEKKSVTGVPYTQQLYTLSYESNTIDHEEINTYIGSDNNKLVATNMGINVVEYLESNFKDIMDYKFTINMERQLDDISLNKLNWMDVLRPFNDNICSIINNLKHTTSMITIGKCEQYTYTVSKGKYGDIVNQIDSNNKVVNKAPKHAINNIDDINLVKEAFEYPKLICKINRSKALLKKGKFGIYICVGKNKYPLPKDTIEKDIDKEFIQSLIKNHVNKFTVGNITYSIMDGPYGIYAKVSQKDKKDYNISLKDISGVNDVDENNIEQLLNTNNKFLLKEFNINDNKCFLMRGKKNMYIKTLTKNISLPAKLKLEDVDDNVVINALNKK